MWIFSLHGAAAQAIISVYDKYLTSDTIALYDTVSQNALFDQAIFDVDIFALEQPIILRLKPKQSIKGGSFFFEYIQTEDDPSMQVFEVKAVCKSETGRYT